MPTWPIVVARRPENKAFGPEFTRQKPNPPGGPGVPIQAIAG